MGFPAGTQKCLAQRSPFQSLIGFYGFSGSPLSELLKLSRQSFVSIPDRVLWVFRQYADFNELVKNLFQSLIGFYGFSGLLRYNYRKYCAKFQSLIGFYGFSGRRHFEAVLKVAEFQSLIGFYGFSGPLLGIDGRSI